MAGWERKTFRLDPWSWRNLLRRAELLRRRGNPKANPSVALRHILRRLRFPDDAPEAPKPAPTPRLSPAQRRARELEGGRD